MSDTGLLPVDGGQIYYEVEGSGHPLLLIHCGLANLRQWDPHVARLAERYRVIRYDTRGYGRSETEDVEFSNVADAAAVLDHAGAKSAYVLGHSRGGLFGLDLALAHPERVDAFISMASGVGGYEAKLPEGVEPPPFAEMERLWNAKDWDALAELETRVWVDGWAQPATRVAPDIRRTVRDWILTTYREEKCEGKPQSLKPRAVERLNELRCPTLVMIGTVDEPGGVLAARHLAATTGARLEEFDSAHMINMEHPKRFEDLVLSFLGGLDRKAA